MQPPRNARVNDTESGPEFSSAGAEFVRLAWEAGVSPEQQQLARRALSADLDCIDAYVILEMYGDSIGEKLALLREGSRIGERLWSPYLQRTDINWWNCNATLPFMRALYRYGNVCIEAGDLDEADRAFRMIMKLNPDDLQFVRNQLFTLLILRRQHEEIYAIVRKFPGQSALRSSVEYLFFKAIEHAGERANETALRIHDWNPHFVPLLRIALDGGRVLTTPNSAHSEPKSHEEALDALASSWKMIEHPKLMARALPNLLEAIGEIELRAKVNTK